MKSLFTTLAAFLVVQQAVARNVFRPPPKEGDKPPGWDDSEEEPYHIVDPDADPQPDNKLGTWLYGYTDCKKNYGPNAKKIIDKAYYDAWTMSKAKGVASNIDWNNVAAVEFLGAPGVNKNEQKQIQAVLANVATVIYGLPAQPFGHYLKVRCDDPKERCDKRKKKDKCEPHPADSTGDDNLPLAYSRNHDTKDVAYPMINFCKGFFDRKNLKDAIAHGKSQNAPEHLRLANYDNQAQTFLHELMHLNIAANSPLPNPKIVDLSLTIDTSDADHPIRKLVTKAYGPLFTKILARWQGDEDTSTGYYVQRNADNLAYYILAKYVTKQLDNTYPHLPIVTYESDGPPYPDFGSGDWAQLLPIVRRAGGTRLNAKDSAIKAWTEGGANGLGGDYPDCSDDDADDPMPKPKAEPISLDEFHVNDEYPKEYIEQLFKWAKELSK